MRGLKLKIDVKKNNNYLNIISHYSRYCFLNRYQSFISVDYLFECFDWAFVIL